MIITKKTLLSALLVTACALSTTIAQQADQPKRQLKFETSQETKISQETKSLQETKGWSKAWEGMGVIKPTHVAIFTMKKDRDLRQGSYDRLAQSVKDLVSDEQVALLKQGHSMGYYNEPGDLFTTYRLYAVSEEDARNMAKGVIRLLDEVADSRIKAAEEKLQEYRNDVIEIQKKIKDKEAEIKTAEAQKQKDIVEYKRQLEAAKTEFDNAKKKYFYDEREDAAKSMSEFNKMVNTLKIDIAGYRAKIEVIKRVRLPGASRNSSITPKQIQFQMLLEQEAELAGALARMQTAERARSEAAHFCQLLDKLNDAHGKHRSACKRKIDQSGPKILGEKLEKTYEEIKRYDNFWANLPGEYLPVTVHDNKVFVHPVDSSKREKVPYPRKSAPKRSRTPTRRGDPRAW